MKKGIISQSNYVPWKGYFDAINFVDIFVIYDNVQYTIRDWRNRNIIKTIKGLKWLTIPVHGDRNKNIRDIRVADKKWAEKHRKIIHDSYNSTKYYKEFSNVLDTAYKKCSEFNFLSDINLYFIELICNMLSINTEIKSSNIFNLDNKDKNQKLIHICTELGIDKYYTGPKAKNYLDEKLFKKKGIEVFYFDYSGYPEYSQLYPPFAHEVSIVDLFLNTGKDIKKYMKTFNNLKMIENE